MVTPANSAQASHEISEDRLAGRLGASSRYALTQRRVR